jgi:hypothetical protein
VHGLPQLLARLDVEKRHDEKDYGEQHHHCVLHLGTPLLSWPGAKNGSIEKIKSSIAQSPFAPEPDLRVRNPALGRANCLTEIDSALQQL